MARSESRTFRCDVVAAETADLLKFDFCMVALIDIEYLGCTQGPRLDQVARTRSIRMPKGALEISFQRQTRFEEHTRTTLSNESD